MLLSQNFGADTIPSKPSEVFRKPSKNIFKYQGLLEVSVNRAYLTKSHTMGGNPTVGLL